MAYCPSQLHGGECCQRACTPWQCTQQQLFRKSNKYFVCWKGQEVELTARPGFICLVDGRALVARFLILVRDVGRHADDGTIQSATIQLHI